MGKVAESEGTMSKGKKGKRGERGGKDRPKPYKKLSKEVEVIGESSKKKNRDDKDQLEDGDIKVVFVKKPLANSSSSTSEESDEVTEVDPWKYVHFLEAGVSYGSN